LFVPAFMIVPGLLVAESSALIVPTIKVA